MEDETKVTKLNQKPEVNAETLSATMWGVCVCICVR